MEVNLVIKYMLAAEGLEPEDAERERYWEGERDVWVSVHARLVVSFLPVTNEGRWLLARGGQRGERREREASAMPCPALWPGCS